MVTVKRIFLLFLFAFLFFSIAKNFFDYQKKIQFYQDFKKLYEKEQYQNRKLKTEIIRKKSLNELEKTIRNKLHLSKIDEVVVLMNPISILSEPPPQKPIPNWQKWWLIFTQK
jgi:hypothetical protein